MEERRVIIILIKEGRTKRLKKNNFINMTNHYNYNDRFEYEVGDKVNICETLNE